MKREITYKPKSGTREHKLFKMQIGKTCYFDKELMDSIKSSIVRVKRRTGQVYETRSTQKQLRVKRIS